MKIQSPKVFEKDFALSKSSVNGLSEAEVISAGVHARVPPCRGGLSAVKLLAAGKIGVSRRDQGLGRHVVALSSISAAYTTLPYTSRRPV